MSSVEHKVAMHQLASERRAAGKPVWDRKVRLGDVFHNSDLTFEHRRDEIVRRIRATSWFREGKDSELVGTVHCLATADSPDEWDEWWDALYDMADYDRVWIDTLSRR